VSIAFTAARMYAFGPLRARSRVKRTSVESIGRPSENLTPERRWKVHVSWSEDSS